MKLNDEEKRKKAFEKRLEYQKNAKERAIKKYKEKIQKEKELGINSIKNKKYLTKFSEKMKIMHERDKEFYRICWNNKPHYCKNCGKYLGDKFEEVTINKEGEKEYKIINLFRYAHIIPKSIYPYLRHYINNIFLLCLDCHTLFDNGTKEERKKMKIYNEDLFDLLKQLHKKLKKDNNNIFS